MTAYRAVATGGSTDGSDPSATITPAIGDLFVVFCNASGNTNTAPTCADNNGGVYTPIGTAAWDTSANTGSWFVRTKPLPNTTSTIVTVTAGAQTAAQISVVAYSGSPRFGLSAIRSSGSQANQAAASTPAPALNQNALTGNPTVCAVFSGDQTTTPNASWTERTEASQITPTTALEVATRDSGFTSTTITFGASCSTAFASVALELDESTPTFLGAYPTSAAAMAAAAGYGSYNAGYLCNEASGDLVPTFGSGNLTATGLAYGAAGMLADAAEDAVTLTVGDTADGGDIHDPGTGDMVTFVVLKFSTRGTGRIVGKRNGTTTGWSLHDNTTQFILNVDTATAPNVSVTANYSGTGEWVVVAVMLERATSKQRIAFWAPSTGYVASTAALGPGDAGTLSDASALFIAGSANMDLDALFVGYGAGAATGMTAGIITALASFVDYLLVVQPTGFKNLLLLDVG